MQTSAGVRTGTRSAAFAFAVVSAILVSACSDLPNKTQALETVQHDIKEDATCTLPISMLAKFKMQHLSKAICVTRESGVQGDAAMKCLDALVSVGVTKRKEPGYMAEWPDELGGTALSDVSPYERRARDLIFKGCVEQTGDLREGSFRCGQAHADKIIRISKKEEGRALVRYSRVITFDPKLDIIEKACGQVSRPGPEATATFEKVDKSWRLVPDDGAPATSPSL